jgi:tripartite ATP-independent transporter DctP family solute receptor
MKKEILSRFFGLLVIFVLVLSLSNMATATKILRIGNIQNPDQAVNQACLKFGELVKKKTNGSIEVKVFPNSQLGNATTQIQSVKMGTLDAFVDGVGWLSQLVSDFNLPLTPYAMKSVEQSVHVMQGEIGQEMAEKLRKQYGLRMIDVSWKRLPRHLLSKRPVRTVNDLKGLKLRVAEAVINIEAWKAMGASPTPIAFSEVYLALQQGIVDAMECPLDMIYTQKFHEVAKYLSLTGHLSEPSAFIMNEKYFQGLTPKEQKAIFEAAAEAGKLNNKMLTAKEKEVMELMKKEGVIFIKVNRQEFIDKCKNVPAIIEEKGLCTKGLYERAMKVK